MSNDRTINRTWNDTFDWHLSNGYTPFHVSTTYNEPREHPLTAQRATHVLKQFHARLLGYLLNTRNYHRGGLRAMQPKAFCFLDSSGSKRKRLASIPKHQSTFHHHSIYFVRKTISERMQRLTDENESARFKETCPSLRSLMVQRAEGDRAAQMTKLISYVTKYVRLNPNEPDNMTLFPPSASEFQKPTGA